MESRRIIVSEVLSSRYEPGERPVSWDKRFSGYDEVRTVEGETVRLLSDGGQSSPAPGWELLLTKPSPQDNTAFQWTLYGILPGVAAGACECCCGCE